MRAMYWFTGLAALLLPLVAAAATPADVHLERWPDASTSFNQPIAVRAPDDDSGRVFVIERCSGIRVVRDGALLPTPFLEIDASCVFEQGILGLAFDPDFAVNGNFYVTYTAPASDPRLGSTADQVLARFRVFPPSADVATGVATEILRVPDIAANHNGGDLHFGPDGYLYWSMGDGGVQGDPYGFAQCTGRKKADTGACHDTSGSGPDYYLLGKIIRLDVRGGRANAAGANWCGAAPGSSANYSIPAGNPFADAAAHPDECAEVFHWGLRNPFRFSFDRATGDLLIGDVGQGRYEEINFLPVGTGGSDFQWNACEGRHSYPGGVSDCTGPVGSVPPRIEYPHTQSRCSVTGGFVYRGPIQSLRGQYVFSDYCGGQVHIAADPDPDAPEWSYETLPATPPLNAYSFGEDTRGNLFLTDGGGPIWRFTSDIIFTDDFEE